MNASSLRRHDIDWLRIGAVYLLFLFHSAMVFNPAPFYHIRNAELSIGFMILCGFIGLWHMPLLFLLAGWSIKDSLLKYGRRGFLRKRVLRLAVPLLAGSILFGPAIKYCELKSGLDANFHGLFVSEELQASFQQVIPSGLPRAEPFDESFLAFLPTFFTQLDRFTWSHLWFLAYLFTFSLLYVSIYHRIARSGRHFEHVSSLWVYAPIVPLALVQIFLRPYFPGLQTLVSDWANFAYYSIYLSIGVGMAAFPAFETALQRESRRAFGICLATLGVLLLAVFHVITSEPVILAGTAVAGWSFIVGLLGFARRRLNRPVASLPYQIEASLPIYILHQPAIVLIGYAVIQLPLGIAAKFSLLLALAVLVTFLFYHVFVRTNRWMRFLHGMGTRPRAIEALSNGVVRLPHPVRSP